MTESAPETRKRAIREFFLAKSDRAKMDQPNPLFAGRDRVIDSVLHDVGRLERSHRPIGDLSTVLHGAPGAGKSETLAQLRARIHALRFDSPVAIVEGGVDVLTDARALMQSLREQSPPRLRERLKDAWRTMAEVRGGTGGAGLSVGLRPPEPPMWEVTRLKDFARTIGPPEKQPTIILFIDEAQKEVRRAASRDEDFAMAFHKGQAGLKVFPIYAGLGDTLDALRDCGVSRPEDGKRHPLRRLPNRHVAAMAREALIALTGAHSPELGRWANRIVEYTQGWPMHLSHALGAIAERAVPDWRLDNGKFSEAMRDASAKRARYYDDRLNACSRLRPGMHGRWARLFANGFRANVDHVAKAMGLSEDDADSLVAQAVEAGLLERDGTLYLSPIPSLIDHIEGLDREARRGPGAT